MGYYVQYISQVTWDKCQTVSTAALPWAADGLDRSSDVKIYQPGVEDIPTGQAMDLGWRPE